MLRDVKTLVERDLERSKSTNELQELCLTFERGTQGQCCSEGEEAKSPH